MASKSNTQGRAYEYACLISLYEKISEMRPTCIIQDGCVDICLNSWNRISESDRFIYKRSADAAVDRILELEPRIYESTGDTLELFIQPDQKGEDGDVRDILIIRDKIKWEIGLSLKHNNFAVKHSRLGSILDFASSWFGIPCSDRYWEEIKPVFNRLTIEKEQGKLFKDLEDKENSVYVPILESFMKEMKFLMSNYPEVPAKLVEYLLGKFDFYKIISVDSQEYTSIQSVNIHNTLNKSAGSVVSPYKIPHVKLPTRLIHIGFMPESRTTLELYLDGGWQFTFRIHNASKYVEPSLKFDIKIIGMPATIITINCRWN